MTLTPRPAAALSAVRISGWERRVTGPEKFRPCFADEVGEDGEDGEGQPAVAVRGLRSGPDGREPGLSDFHVEPRGQQAGEVRTVAAGCNHSSSVDGGRRLRKNGIGLHPGDGVRPGDPSKPDSAIVSGTLVSALSDHVGCADCPTGTRARVCRRPRCPSSAANSRSRAHSRCPTPC
jgi:hypothetical protein